MQLTYQPALPSDIDAIYSFTKELIDQYEDKNQISYEKVLAWVRKKLERQTLWTRTPWNWTTCICSPPSGVMASALP